MEEIKELEIPSLNITIRVGDIFLVDKHYTKLTSILTASDQLGVYACYPHLGGKMYTLINFVNGYECGEIKSISQLRDDKLSELL